MHLSKKTLASVAIAALPSLVVATPIKMSPNPEKQLGRRTLSGVACGLFQGADAQNMAQSQGALKDKGSGTAVVVPAKGCSRIGCYNTSGTYVCNDQDVEITITLGDVITATDSILNLCDDESGQVHKGISGQIFSDQAGGYNVDVAYCNANDPGNTPPSSYTTSNNSPGSVQCGGNRPDVSCTAGRSCDPGTIVMTSQTTVACDEYMGPVYIRAGALYVYSTTRTITESWSLGGDLGIDSSDLATAALSATFSAAFIHSTTTGDNAGSSQNCGPQNQSPLGNYTCGMDISPKCLQMSGSCKVAGVTVPWQITSPKLTATDGQSVYTPNICTCTECPAADEQGAPPPCGLSCQTCDTPPGYTGSSSNGQKAATNNNNGTSTGGEKAVAASIAKSSGTATALVSGAPLASSATLPGPKEAAIKTVSGDTSNALLLPSSAVSAVPSPKEAAISQAAGASNNALLPASSALSAAPTLKQAAINQAVGGSSNALSTPASAVSAVPTPKQAAVNEAAGGSSNALLTPSSAASAVPTPKEAAVNEATGGSSNALVTPSNTASSVPTPVEAAVNVAPTPAAGSSDATTLVTSSSTNASPLLVRAAVTDAPKSLVATFVMKPSGKRIYSSPGVSFVGP